jgi:hypothetical protein
MLIPFGVLSAAGAEVGAEPAYELIASEILTTTEASVVFSNLGDYSSTYKHLQIRMTARTTRAQNDDALFLRLNGDTGSNYARHQLLGNGSTVSSTAGTSETSTGQNATAGTNTTANVFGAAVFDFLDVFNSTKNTTLRSFSGLAANFNQIMLGSGLFINTASVTSISIEANGNLLAGSRFSLYGIR